MPFSFLRNTRCAVAFFGKRNILNPSGPNVAGKVGCMDKVKLNEGELSVLLACTSEATEYDGEGSFQTEDVTVAGMTKRQVCGYLSQLEQKGLFITDRDAYYSGHFTALGLSMIEGLSTAAAASPTDLTTAPIPPKP